MEVESAASRLEFSDVRFRRDRDPSDSGQPL